MPLRSEQKRPKTSGGEGLIPGWKMKVPARSMLVRNSHKIQAPRGRAEAPIKLQARNREGSVDIPSVERSRASSTSSWFTKSSGQEHEDGEFDADEDEMSMEAGRAAKNEGARPMVKGHKTQVHRSISIKMTQHWSSHTFRVLKLKLSLSQMRSPGSIRKRRRKSTPLLHYPSHLPRMPGIWLDGTRGSREAWFVGALPFKIPLALMVRCETPWFIYGRRSSRNSATR